MYYAYINNTQDTRLFSQVTKASSLKDRMIGLLKHKSLNDNEAMWIKPCNSIQTFFMRFTIDAAFLDQNNTIVRLYTSLKPFKLTSIVFAAHSVLEMPEGSVEKHQLKIGDVFYFTEHVS